MNLILLEDHHFIAPSQAQLGQSYSTHLSQVLGVKIGDWVTVGRLNGNIGRAQIVDLAPEQTTLAVGPLDEPAPPPLPVVLLLALPRPRMLQRTLQTVATMGVEHLCLLQTRRVEKSYWQTPLLKADAVHQQLVTGLEQGKATQLPQVSYHQRFRPFVEDELPGLASGRRRLLAHPGEYSPCPHLAQTPSIIAVGPEGGFIEHEVALFKEAGFETVKLGERILRVETAVPALLARLFY